MPETMKPPAGASWLLSIFTGEPDFQQVDGDLREEFHQLVLREGTEAARKWYWREVFRNAWAFSMRPSTIRLLTAAALCVLILRLTNSPLNRWLRAALMPAPRVLGLGLLLRTLIHTGLVLGLGYSAESILQRREPRLPEAFTCLYLLVLAGWVCVTHYYQLWLLAPGRIPVDLVSTIVVVCVYWIGVAWARRSGSGGARLPRFIS
jgi:hypothetical protein